MKQRIETAPGVSLAYTLDDYTDPWVDAETIILIHGIAESGEVWHAWVPHLARRYKVIRLDLRGFGDSTPMPLDYEWSIAALADDLDAFVTRLGLARVHLAGAKLGGLISMKFAATRPQKMRTLIVSGATVKLDFLAPSIPEKVRRMKEESIRAWAESTMRDRLGSGLPREAVDWWIDLMGNAPKDSVLGVYRMLPAVDITADLPNINRADARDDVDQERLLRHQRGIRQLAEKHSGFRTRADTRRLVPHFGVVSRRMREQGGRSFSPGEELRRKGCRAMRFRAAAPRRNTPACWSNENPEAFSGDRLEACHFIFTRHSRGRGNSGRRWQTGGWLLSLARPREK